MRKILTIIALFLSMFVAASSAQQKSSETKSSKPEPQTSKKANARPDADKSKAAATEPFEKASAEKMAEQCVTLETEAGAIVLEMLPEFAPETVRNFLNLTALAAYDMTTFSRVVPGFIVQGGNVSTREKAPPELINRAQRTIPDEPNQLRHERGVVSMARSDQPNTASSHFFILVGSGNHLDGTFAAFGRVKSGMETADAINKMPVEGDKPSKPVRLKRATVSPCPATQTETKQTPN